MPDSLEARIARLNAIFRDVRSLITFRNFVKSEFSNENVDFILCVRDLNPALPMSAGRALPADISTDSRIAKYIFDRFIPDSARQMINLPFEMRQRLIDLDETMMLEHDSFDEAHGEIVQLVARDSYVRFKNKYPEFG